MPDSWTTPAEVKETTLCLPIRGDPPCSVLLGLKKAGFGAGRWTGFGGKLQAGETVAEAAVRELQEEAGLQIREKDLRRAGLLTFLFPWQPAWSQTVHVFVVATWHGEPRESAEMAPAWFAFDDLPLARMWQDGAYWLPPILAGDRIRAHFTFAADNETIDRVEIEAWDAAGCPSLQTQDEVEVIASGEGVTTTHPMGPAISR